MRTLCTVFSLLALSVSLGRAAERPNIVFIIVDDLGPFELSCLGHQIHNTPNIDRMSAEGMRFTQAYSGCCVCAPARSTLMTGYHMGHTTVRGNSGGIPIRAEDVTVAEVLREAGYVCGGFGKWGLGDAGTPGVPEKNGFDVFFGYYDQVHAHFYYPRYLWRSGVKVPLPGNSRPEVDARERQAYQQDKMYVGDQFSHHLILDEAIKFIRANKDRPFFCYCPWTPPHGRWPMPPDEPAMEAFKDRPWPEEAKVFAGMVKMIDRNVGEILALLKELELDEKTIVFFCSDNGGLPSFEELFHPCGPLRGYKGQLYEGGIRVPLIVRWPGRIKPGSKSDHLSYFPDMMPTFAELAGASSSRHVPENIDGISIVPTLLGETALDKRQKQHEYLYWEQPGRRGAQAIRMGKWKAVWPGFGRPNRPPFELYDLSTDVGETNNLAGDHPDLARRVKRAITEAHVPPLAQLEPPTPEGRQYR